MGCRKGEIKSQFTTIKHSLTKLLQGQPLHTLKEHAHWVTTLTLNTDFVLRTGPFDHTGKKPTSDEEGSFS
jgi:hypothetical protein